MFTSEHVDTASKDQEYDVNRAVDLEEYHEDEVERQQEIKEFLPAIEMGHVVRNHDVWHDSSEVGGIEDRTFVISVSSTIATAVMNMVLTHKAHQYQG